MSALVGPALFPFSLAAAVMVALVLVEALSLLAGQSASALLDGAIAPDGIDAVEAPDGLSPVALLSWINLGRAPFLILLILGLALFALAGFVLQGLATALLAPLPALAAVPLAASAALPVLRLTSGAVARLIPRDESYAVTADELVGATAEVILGPLDQGLPGQVRARDRHGNVHALRARAAADAAPMATGTRVLLVDRVDAVYVAIPAPADL